MLNISMGGGGGVVVIFILGLLLNTFSKILQSYLLIIKLIGENIKTLKSYIITSFSIFGQNHQYKHLFSYDHRCILICYKKKLLTYKI